MLGLKTLLDHIDITLLNAELYGVGTEWDYQQVNNPFSRIYYLTEGHGTIQHHDQTYTLHPGHLYLIPCYTPVDMHCPQHFTHYYLHFTTRLPAGIDILSLLTCSYQVNAAEHGISTDLFDRLLQLNPDKALIEYDATRPIYQQVLDRANHLDQAKPPGNLIESNGLLRMLLATFFTQQAFPETHNTLHGLTRFARVFAYIQEHLHTPITLKELAELVDLSPTYFSNLFSKLMGITPIQYINKRRVEEVQIRLLTTHDPLWRIAREVGFLDAFYLSRVFKKTVGVSPAHYRRQNLWIHPHDGLLANGS